MKKAPLPKKTQRRNRPQTNGNDFNPRELLAALMAFKRGDFSARLPEDWVGVPGKIADTFNTVIETNQRMARELERIGQRCRQRRPDYTARFYRRSDQFLG